MNILLTGYKGFIGSHLYRALVEQGHNVEVYEWGEAPGSVFLQDWVIHLGAISSTTEKDVEKIMRQNVDYSIELFDQCSRYGVNFQFASSASVYGMGKEFKEESPVDPRNAYAWSKYLVERHIFQRKQKWVESTEAKVQVFRYFNVYGPGEDHKKNQASPFYQFQKQAIMNGEVKVFEGSENYKRDFIHVTSIVDYHLRFLEVNKSGIWNFGTGKPMSFLDVAKQLNVPIKTIPMPDNLKPHYQTYTCADLTRLNDTIGPIA